MPVKSVIEAVHDAMYEEMKRDPCVFVMGEDVGKRGGVFLATQGFLEDDVGRPKVEARVRALARLNPSCRIEALHADVARLGLGALGDVDLIFSCVDSMATRALIINEQAFRLGVPWVDAAVDGSGKTCVSRVAAFGGSPDAPCYLCAHDSQSLSEALRESLPRGCPTWRWGQARPMTAPTLAISAVGAAIAAAQVIWGLKILLGRADDVVGREQFLDLDRQSSTVYELARNPRCVFDHCAWSFTPVGRTVREVTVGETFAIAENRLGDGVTLELHRSALVTALRCPGCGSESQPYRLLEVVTAEDAACACGESMEPQPIGLHDRFGRDEASPVLGRTWSELGVPDRDVVTAVRGDAELHLLFE